MTGPWKELTPPYGTIVADPPWPYRTADRLPTNGTRRRPAAARYTPMTWEQIADLPVGALAAADAHLYLWITTPLLLGDRAQGSNPGEVLAAWGFRYVTAITWIKTGPPGLGWHFRGVTEHCLFAVRGRAPIPPALRQPNVLDPERLCGVGFAAARTGHSAKPALLLDIAERISPAPRVELFARQPRLGWHHWGWGHERAGGRL